MRWLRWSSNDAGASRTFAPDTAVGTSTRLAVSSRWLTRRVPKAPPELRSRESAVFVPTAFISGISGQFYRQFALTIASATIISAMVSLTLSPAMAALVLRRHPEHPTPAKGWRRPFQVFGQRFNHAFERLSERYAWLTARTVRRGALMLALFVLLASAFLAVRLILAWTPLRMALTPGRTKTRRVHRRAVELFRAGCELKTRGRTGVLLYLSVAEHRAEIVADKAIADHVEPEAWGEAMAALVDEVKAGRPGEGMAKAVERIGAVLARILPKTLDNPNELPDRLIEL